MIIVAIRGSALCYATKELRADRDVALVAVSQSGWALSCVAEPLKQDRDLVLAALRTNPAALDYVHASVRDDPVIMWASSFAGGRASGQYGACGTIPSEMACALM
eukprot:TRINITY_DN29531_c0_g1_i2.p1 TRINITY_DN29531_c0_g1~~TRINITY_DN29531_c0_g1_i2.p1  ORF type:complete len:105 (+),score=15.39 TRINITY_DN29531_c0_g1_i2:231-545(+)